MRGLSLAAPVRSRPLRPAPSISHPAATATTATTTTTTTDPRSRLQSRSRLQPSESLSGDGDDCGGGDGVLLLTQPRAVTALPLRALSAHCHSALSALVGVPGARSPDAVARLPLTGARVTLLPTPLSRSAQEEAGAVAAAAVAAPPVPLAPSRDAFLAELGLHSEQQQQQQQQHQQQQQQQQQEGQRHEYNPESMSSSPAAAAASTGAAVAGVWPDNAPPALVVAGTAPSLLTVTNTVTGSSCSRTAIKTGTATVSRPSHTVALPVEHSDWTAPDLPHSSSSHPSHSYSAHGHGAHIHGL